MPRHALQRLATATLVSFACAAGAQTVQQDVHRHGQDVMPFDLARTVHVFRMTEDGGVQQVVTRGEAADPAQVALIRHHLSMEAAAFARGDYGDPGRLHGAGMPGLRELQAGAARVQVRYEPLPDGGQIVFRAADIALVTAIHRWFGAQLSEHGADAQAQ